MHIQCRGKGREPAAVLKRLPVITAGVSCPLESPSKPYPRLTQLLGHTAYQHPISFCRPLCRGTKDDGKVREEVLRQDMDDWRENTLVRCMMRAFRVRAAGGRWRWQWWWRRLSCFSIPLVYPPTPSFFFFIIATIPARLLGENWFYATRLSGAGKIAREGKIRQRKNKGAEGYAKEALRTDAWRSVNQGAGDYRF